MRYPEKELKHCNAMNELHRCRHCGCSYKVHMHIYFEQKKIYQEIKPIKKYFFQKIDGKQIIEKRISSFKEEQIKISEAMAKFASFLKKYSIWEYNKGFEDLMMLEIKKAEKEDSQNVSRLRNILENHVDLVKKIDDYFQKTTNDHNFHAKEICDLKEELFKLPTYGKEIKFMFDLNYSSLLSDYKKKNVIHYNLARKL
uniref:Uncharacterized protein n=1 Tax=Panagrolaimus sp. JU765 TaxID=591449 RepID=A0AC34QC98_9BILA